MTSDELRKLAKTSVPIDSDIAYENDLVVVSRLYLFNQETRTTFYELNLCMKDEISGDIYSAISVMYQKI